MLIDKTYKLNTDSYIHLRCAIAYMNLKRLVEFLVASDDKR